MQTNSTLFDLELRSQQRVFDESELAAVAFLARYSGRTLEAYRQDLRSYFTWAEAAGLEVLTATRPHVELSGRTWNSEDSPRRRSIVA